jgi:hypothetical protein
MARSVALGIAAVLLAATVLLAQTDERTRIFDASVERLWTVTRSALRATGWDIEKEDKNAGLILTDSRRLDGEDFAVYASGVKHRLRVLLKAMPDGKTSVTIERRLWKEERILWMDRSRDLPTTDHKIETEILDAIGAAL